MAEGYCNFDPFPDLSVTHSDICLSDGYNVITQPPESMKFFSQKVTEKKNRNEINFALL